MAGALRQTSDNTVRQARSASCLGLRSGRVLRFLQDSAALCCWAAGRMQAARCWGAHAWVRSSWERAVYYARRPARSNVQLGFVSALLNNWDYHIALPAGAGAMGRRGPPLSGS